MKSANRNYDRLLSLMKDLNATRPIARVYGDL